MEMFRLLPDEALAPPTDDADADGSTEPEDADVGTEADDNADEASDEDSDGPVSRAKYDADLAAMQGTIAELKTTVGRAQSLARQVSQASNSADVMAQLREQNTVVAGLFEALIDGIDPDSIDANLVAKIKQASAEIREAERRAQMMDEIREELGISPSAARDREELEDLQSQANAVASDIEDLIVDADLDPNDNELFPWAQWAEMFKSAAEAGQDPERVVRRAAVKAIRDAQAADSAGDRREQRRGATGRGPKGAASSAKRDPLTTGDLASRMKELQRLTGRA